MAYAPTAVTGFSVAYAIDQPDNRGEYTRLKLNARLLAKLITQSYLASERGRGHPGMSQNPVSINLDPEFQKLNPGLDQIGREAAATVLSLSESSDVIETLTSYIADDADALAFVNGKADPWGMKVNPSYKKISLPTAEWPLLDDYVPPTNDECYLQNPAPYFTQIAAPVTSLRKIAEAVLDAWPNVQTRCERATVTDPWKLGRVERQGVGSRFMMGIVSVGDARRLDLAEASLETAGRTYVAPTDAAMAKAVRLAEPSRSGDEPFTLDMRTLVKNHAYPGTMIVYTAARTANLPKEDAAKVAEFIDVATSEGQVAGFGNGELPEGYLPLKRTGVTARCGSRPRRSRSRSASRRAPRSPARARAAARARAPAARARAAVASPRSARAASRTSGPRAPTTFPPPTTPAPAPARARVTARAQERARATARTGPTTARSSSPCRPRPRSPRRSRSASCRSSCW